jgi:hypothetical protein
VWADWTAESSKEERTVVLRAEPERDEGGDDMVPCLRRWIRGDLAGLMGLAAKVRDRRSASSTYVF